MENECRSMQLINSEGDFNVEGVDEFMQKTELSKFGLSYSLVAIMGPQSSGKSTLLNHLFHTNFKEMDASEGRNQTTKGIWMENCAGIEPFIITMDLEGSDGVERGEDDTAFERQTALFALAIADIVIINMWCHDIGREQAASKPLLRIVFQAMMSLFGARKITLLFVLRDKTKTPESVLQRTVRKDTEKIWDSVLKPTSHINSPLSEFFNVEVVALSNYEEKEELFTEQVAQLRQRLLDSIREGRFAGDRQCLVPASEFSFNAQHIWRTIKENKDLDLHALKVMIATIRCEEIANQKLLQLSSNEDWLALKEAIPSGQVPSSFGSNLNSILEIYFSEYDKETIHYDEGVRNEKRQQLESKTLDIVRPIYIKLLEHWQSKAMDNFKSRLEQMLNEGLGFAASATTCHRSVMLEFDKACEDATNRYVNFQIDTSEVREKLCRDIDSYKLSVRDSILSKWKVNYEEGLKNSLSVQLEYLFTNPKENTWASIRRYITSKIEIGISKLSDGISGLELENEERNKIMQDLRDSARNVVERKAREQAKKVLYSMKERFVVILNSATGRKKFSEKLIRKCHTESLRVLSVMAAMRLDDKTDKIEEMLVFSLENDNLRSEALASNTWPQVSPEDTLITPAECVSLWESFQVETFPLKQEFYALKVGIPQKIAAYVPVVATIITNLVTGGGGN